MAWNDPEWEVKVRVNKYTQARKFKEDLKSMPDDWTLTDILEHKGAKNDQRDFDYYTFIFKGKSSERPQL